MYPRRRHERRKPGQKIERLQHDVRRPVSIPRLEAIAHLPLRGQREPLHRHRRAAHIAGEPLQLRALIGFDPDARVQRKPRVLRDTFPRLLVPRRALVRFPSVGPLLFAYCSTFLAIANADPVTPSIDELRAFTTDYDGETRPDLLPIWLKLRVALGDAESLEKLERIFTAADLNLVKGFRERSAELDMDEGRMFSDSLKKLCQDLEDLDGESIGREVARIDRSANERKDSMAREFIATLSRDAAQALIEQAERTRGRVKGSYTDVAAVAARFPDYVKEQYRQRCISFGFIPALGPGSDDTTSR